jgi:hypothetical protein
MDNMWTIILIVAAIIIGILYFNVRSARKKREGK